MKFIKLCTGILVLLSAFSSQMAFGQTQADMNFESCEGYKKADAELNRLYKRIINDYNKESIFIEKLIVAQRAWLAYRDAHIASIYPKKNKSLHYGSIYPTCFCADMEKITIERTTLLRQWLIVVPEGEVCVGSIRQK